MGWFGVFETDKTEAFRNLFCQRQYKKKFELLWEKHLGNRSIAVYSLDGKCMGQTILWTVDDDGIMYKPISWSDSMEYIPKKWLKKLLEDATDLEKECYNAFIQKKQLKDSIKSGTVVKLDSPITFNNDLVDDTFKCFSYGRAWAVNLKIFVSGITKEYIVSKGFEIVS